MSENHENDKLKTDIQINWDEKSFSFKKKGSISNSIKETAEKVTNFYEESSRVFSNIGIEENLSKDEIINNEDKNFRLKSMIESEISFTNDKGTGFLGTLFIYIKVNIVSGFLFLPHGFLIGGWLFSVISIILISMLVAFCNVSLASCAEEADSYSFTTIGFKSLGKFGKYVVEYGIAISQICFPCSYANLIATVMGKLFHIWFEVDENEYYWYFGIALLIILIPLCYLRNISSFSQMHFIGDIAVLATIIVLLINSCKQISKNPLNINEIPMISKDWPKFLGMSITTLEGIGVILPIKEGMKDKNQFNKVVYIGMTIVAIILIAFPLVAVLSYGQKTPEIIVEKLEFKELYIQVIMILLIFSILVVYPVQLNPAFRIFENNLIKSEENRILYGNIIRTSILILTIVIGISSIDKFATLMALAGCAVCTPIALILPTLFHFKLFNYKQSLLRSIIDILISVIGIGLSLTILVFTFIN